MNAILIRESCICLCLLALSALLIFPAFSQEENRLNGKEILALLSDSWVKGDDFEQSFGIPDGPVSASTTYWQGGNPSYGRWRVEKDQYCSQWQQNGPWGCYDVSSFQSNEETHIIWTDISGRRYKGILMPR